MLRSRLAGATIGCLAAIAGIAVHAQAGETYSIVAQSTPSSAATGRPPLSARIAAANLPIIAQVATTPPHGAVPKAISHPREQSAEARVEPALPQENMAVAAVRVDHELESVTEPAPRPSLTMPVLWPFGSMKWPMSSPQPPSAARKPASTPKAKAPERQADIGSKSVAAGTKPAAAGRGGPRQASASSSGKGLSGSSPVSVTR